MTEQAAPQRRSGRPHEAGNNEITPDHLMLGALSDPESLTAGKKS
ncbi:Clp protease N-terminal domain-containing protein [Mycobacterium sp.]